MAYSEEELQSYVDGNNIPPEYVRIITKSGGAVWVNPTAVDTIAKYESGELTGGGAESAAAGVWLRVLPPYVPPEPASVAAVQHPISNIQQTQRAEEVINKMLPPTTFVVKITVQISPKKESIFGGIPIKINIQPAQTAKSSQTINYQFNINTIPIDVNISEPLITSAFQFLRTAIDTYVDEDRELKTLLNYGEDKQTVVLGYRRGPLDSNTIDTIQLKLLQEVPSDIDVNTPVFLSREVSKTLIDKVRIRFAPALDETPYLRPKNLSAKIDLDTGKSLSNVTLTKLSLQTGSIGSNDAYHNTTFEDQIFRQWYSYDFNSSELNIDFTDYNNFIFYGSAAMRLAAFKQKLKTLEKLDSRRLQFASSSTYQGTSESAGFVFLQNESGKHAAEIEDIIRSFDRYEQYLYFTPSSSNSMYTASAYYADGGYEYNPIGYWPKTSSGSLYSVSNDVADEWYTSQSLIAQRFDEFNENNLINTLPTHIREDDDNSSYITFVSMIGHFVDTIKPYIDQFPNMYSRDLDPNAELSKDLINEIAESVGFKMPTLESTYDLVKTILGENSEVPLRDAVAELHKRILHNLPFFAKAKGTKTALETLLKVNGIHPQLLSVKEMGVPTSGSYYVFDEFSNGVRFLEATSSFIKVPLSASLRTPTTLQLNCLFEKNKSMTILNGDKTWALFVYPHPTIPTLGRIELTSGSLYEPILTSSYQQIFDDLINISVQVSSGTASLQVIQVDREDIIFNSVMKNSTTFANVWNNTQYVYVGASGSEFANSRFDGVIDEFRIWNTPLAPDVLLNTAFDPAANSGNSYSSATDNLLVQLSFNNVDLALLTGSSYINNETNYKNISVSPSLETCSVYNISDTSFSRYNRTIRQELSQVGSSAYITTRIKVAPPPVFSPNTSGGKRLYRNESIMSSDNKNRKRGHNKVTVATSPTDVINQNIIRNFGMENINDALGIPDGFRGIATSSLQMLQTHYNTYYYADVSQNTFLRVLSNIGSVIDQTIEYFIPSKATLLKGVSIEPTVLEQIKINPVRQIRVYGKDTNKTLRAANSLTGSRPDYGATFNVTDTIKAITEATTLAKYDSYKTEVNISDITELTARYSRTTGTVESVTPILDGTTSGLKGNIETDSILNDISANYSPLSTTVSEDISQFIEANYNYLSGIMPTDNFGTLNSDFLLYKAQYDVDLYNMNKVGYSDVNNGKEGAEPYNRLYSRKLSTSEINTPRLGGLTSTYLPALYDIPPSADFRDFGVYTYLNSPEGIYYFTEPVKTPAYSSPLNQTWNDTSQLFNSVTNWEYGDRYNIYDVVYQDIDVSYTSLGELTPNNTKDYITSQIDSGIRAGNKRYYIFKTRSAYSGSLDGGAFYSGSVPSYTPPSLDRVNWELLRFTPSVKKVPKRVVFDTFSEYTAAAKNFKTTTISIDKIIDIPTRYIDTFNIPSIVGGGQVTGEFTMQNVAAMLAMQSSIGNIRVRLYRTPLARTNDLTRPIEVFPTGSHGVLVDASITTANVAEIINPIVTLVAGANPPAAKIYYTIDNFDLTEKSVSVFSIYYFAMEIEKRVPRGYLRKHYRFFRDNSTATKRRNYVGCKNTIDTTVDGLPPVQVFLSEGTDIVVSQTQTNEEIITGGGGQLNVT
jgi:hypothetical protein